MIKTLTLFCFALVTITCFAQQTQTPITGIDAIKLGDSISQISTYGFSFIAVTKFRVSDSSFKLNRLKKILTKDELKDIEFDVKFKESDSGRTFCPDVSVFISSSFKFNQIQHSKTATLALTYFKNKLIDIRIIDSIKHIRANFTYCLKKYGNGFFYELDGYTLHSQAYNHAVNPTDKIPPLKDYRNFPIATIAKELRYRNDIETINWMNGNYSFSYNTCSQPYKFWIEKHIPDYRYGQGCAEAALIIRNDNAFKAMTDCSDATLKQQLINNKQVAN